MGFQSKLITTKVLHTGPVTGRFQRAAKASALHWPRRGGARVLVCFGRLVCSEELSQASSASSSPNTSTKNTSV